MTCPACGASNEICPCGTVVHPRVIFNPPSQPAIAYRSGDYAGFRHALLRALPGETELTQTIGSQTIQVWRPGAEGDLAVQMMEWWAYLADVLTFYNERIATQAYLGVADLPESVNRLIQLLGYRPRPGLGAHATLAALLSSAKPITLPQGFKVQSKPGPGQKPQVFELGAPVTLAPPDAISARVVPASAPLLSADGTTVWLAGAVSGIKPGDKLLLVNAGAVSGGSIGAFAWATVTATRHTADAYGDKVTAVVFTAPVTGLPAGAQAADYALMRAGQSALPWSSRPAGWTTAVFENEFPVIVLERSRGIGIGAGSIFEPVATGIDLASIERGLSAGSLALIDVSGAPSDTTVIPTLARVEAYSEVVWFANGDGTSPPSGDAIAIPIPHTHIRVAPVLSSGFNDNATLATIRFGFTSVGALVGQTSAAAAELGVAGGVLAGDGPFPADATVSVLLQDAAVNGAVAGGATSLDGSTMTLGALGGAPSAGLGPNLQVLFDLFTVTRGETVAGEALGSGDAAVVNQDFTLKKTPVTYFADPASQSGDQFSSTVQVWVNGLEWAEVPSFFGQAPNAQVFTTREDEQGKTHVVFGDGLNGATLPTGAAITASYRTGSGEQAPAAGSLTNILQPQPGLKAVANPLAPTGGADPDPPSKIKTLAPRSVLTFGRAISVDDYQAIAAAAPGVVQAAAAYAFDPISQRPCVTVWVSGDAGAQGAAQAAIAADADPNRPVKVLAAAPLDTRITLSYRRDPRRLDADVQAGIRAALLDGDTGLIGVNAIGIGQAIYDSQIYAACLGVPGVVAVEALSVQTGPRFRPLFILLGPVRRGFNAAADDCSGARHDPGPGRYLSAPNDAAHLSLTPGTP